MRIASIVVFIGGLLSGALGFLIFCYPRTWQKMNARLAQKSISEFDSPKQLAHTKKFGKLLMILAALDLLSLLAMDAVNLFLPLK